MLLCLGSAVAFGAMGVLGKVAYENGATVGTLLTVRFVLAAAVFWAICGGLRGVSRRDALAAVALGAAAYAAQAGGFFAALERMDAAMVSLLVYTFPAMVAVAAIVSGRERADARRLTALALASAGLVLVVAGAGALDPPGVALSLGAAVVYSAYIFAGEGLSRRVDAKRLSALVCTGAAATLTAGSAALGDLRPGELTAAGWGSLAGIALISTVAAIGLFLAGVRRVGPTTASILSTAEPVVTALLAFAAFGEVLTAPQLLGGTLVLAAVLVLAAPARR
jgi:drug/metabolite transporter (DMT)-like permease